MHCNLQNPGFYTAFGPVKKQRFLVQVKVCLLYHIFRLAGVQNDPARDIKHQAGVTVEENFQSVRIVGLKTSHHFFIAGKTLLGCDRRDSGTFLVPSPTDGKCECAACWWRTHPWFSIST